MRKVKDNRKIIKNLENLNADNEFTINGQYDLKEEEVNVEESINEQSENDIIIDESVSDASLGKLVSELKPNAGFPPLRLKKNNNIDNKTRAFQPNIRTILLDNQKTSFTKNNNDSELEIVNSL